MNTEIRKSITNLEDAMALLNEYNTSTTKIHAEAIERIIKDLANYLIEMEG